MGLGSAAADVRVVRTEVGLSVRYVTGALTGETGVDEGAGAGTFDAVALAAFTGFGGFDWRRAIEVFIVVFFGELVALSFISTRCTFRS
jgi:hypothetical protein